MVFSSIPPYLDTSHSNWHQQLNHFSAGNNGASTQLQPAPHPPPPPPPPPPQPHGIGTAGTIRPGSMAERARLANIPMPEGPLKCPRCESTNTKFCYFNNYSLSQPRHFCKTCRRYWTRGGALRSVPVGGGCRRNKRSKGNSSKSPTTCTDRTVGGSGSGVSSAGITSSMSAGGSRLGSTSEVLGLMGGYIPSLRHRPPLQYLTTDFGSGDQLGLNYGGIPNPTSLGAAGDLNFPSSAVLVGGNEDSLLSGTGGLMRFPRLQVQQFPFSGVSDPTYPFEGSIESPGLGAQVRPKTPTSAVISQFASVKMEDNNHNSNNNNNNQELNLLRTQFLGVQGNDQFSTWNPSSGWTDLSAFSSSAMSNPP